MIIFTMVVNDDIDVDDGDDVAGKKWVEGGSSATVFKVLFISLSFNQTSSSSKLIILI